MRDKQAGQVLVISVIFFTVILVLVGALTQYVSQNTRAGRVALAREQAVQLADAAIDKAVFRLNATAGTYTGETGTVLGSGVFDVNVTGSGTARDITITAYVPDETTPLVTKQVKIRASVNATSVSFNYGVQVGDGGLSMGQDSKVTGNVYANGQITSIVGAIITGDAISAGAGGLIDNVTVYGTAYAHAITDSLVKNARGYSFSNSTATGTAAEYSISSCTVDGDASYTTRSSCTVGGAVTTPYAGDPDPAPQSFPIPDSQITAWKNQAAAGGTISGNYALGIGESDTLGPKKITGNLIMDKEATLTLTGPLWVQGIVDIDKDATVALDAAYGSNSEVVLADGIIDLSKEVNFQRAGADSYILALSLSTATNAVSVAKSSDALIIYAPNGTVQVSKSALLREVTGWGLSLAKDTEVQYESGLANVNFSGGPGGSWGLLKGTWREVY